MENRSDSLSNNAEISIPELSLPKGGGAFRGIGETFQPNPFSGSMNITFPVYTSPCRNFEPHLQLEYHSGSGNGEFGLGFRIHLPNISRKTEKGIPRYTNQDIFVWSETDELVPKIQSGGDGSANGGVRQVTEGQTTWTVFSYMPRIENDFAQIEHWTDGENSFWKVTTRDNVTSVYGKTENARIADPNNPHRIFRWLIEKTYDAKGNKTEYFYKRENGDRLDARLSEQNRDHAANLYIERIRYGNYTDDEGRERWNFEVVFDYGEYDIGEDALSHADANPYEPVRPWPVRPDPFSTYRSGFEIRTLRRCCGILMFHRFENELGPAPCLVRATTFTYESDASHSRLASIQVKGFRRRKDGSYDCKAMPPMQFTYTPFRPEASTFRPLRFQGDTVLVPTLSAVHCVDLYGEGLPGFLYTDGKATLYWRSAGDGTFFPPQIPYQFPVDRQLDRAPYSFLSLRGDGVRQLVYASPQRAGFYEAQAPDEWKPYREFESFPHDVLQAGAEYVDMNGDGLADIAINEGNALKIYPSLQEKGFGAPYRAFPDDGVPFPAPDRTGSEQLVGYADFFGDGLSHRFRIRNGSVECWPNLGYGRFAAAVRFDNAPHYGDLFDASRLFVVDVDGDGLSDLVYVHADRIDLYLNAGGNAFAEAVTVPLPETDTPLDRIAFADIHGNGTNCLVFSKIESEVRHYYYDFSCETKPYLLVQAENNLGAVTNIQYASSVKFYLEDERAGKPWKTKLPFPVHVVERMESADRISGSKTVTRFKYHDGYYDPVEREFNGFGFVERWDAEHDDDHTDTGPISGFSLQGYEPELHAPPVYTKRWYHTGAFHAADIISKQYEQDYYRGDPAAYRMPDSAFDAAIDREDADALRQAYRALKGHLLREEIYGLDETGAADHPYRVSEANYCVRLIQPKGSAPCAVFHVVRREEIEYDYERNPFDPRVRHQFVLRTDEYGNELQVCDVHYPRREPRDDQVRTYPEQKQLLLTVRCTDYINRTGGFRLLGIPCDVRLWELGGIDTDGGAYLSFDRLYAKVQDALKRPVLYNEPFTPVLAQARLRTWSRTYFWNEAQDAPLPLGEITALALRHHTEEAVFPDLLFQQLFQDVATRAMLEQDGGYALQDGYWWNRGETRHYYRAEDRRFHLPCMMENVFADGESYLRTKTVVEYDAYSLAPVRTAQFLSDQVSNVISAELDYIALQPKQVIDINNNVSQTRFDPLGYVFVTSVFGTMQGARQGDMDLKDYEEVRAAGIADVLADPDKYIQGASSFFYYDLDSWRTERQPCGFVHLIRETYAGAEGHGGEGDSGERRGKWQVYIDYMDGFGRIAERKSQVDPGPAALIDETGTGVVRAGRIVTVETVDRWLVSGRTVYNNKGHPVKQYMPYFSSTWRYEPQQWADAMLPPPTVTRYDPLERVIRVDTPKGFYRKTEFTAWEERHYDENDTVVDSDYYKDFMRNDPQNPSQRQIDEKNALSKAAACYNTPSVTVLNSAGHPFLDIERNLGAVRSELFQELVSDTAVTAEQLWRQLVDKGYLEIAGEDASVAWVTGKFRPHIRGFRLELDEPYRSLEAGVIAILKPWECITYHVVDMEGRRLRSVDPRLYYRNCQQGTEDSNVRYVYDMKGNALATNSADAGNRRVLSNIFGNPVHVWDGRGFHIATRYDRLQRPVLVHVEGDDGNGLALNQVVEKFVYGESFGDRPEDAQDLNLRGQIYRRYDQAGLVEYALYNIQSKPVRTERRFRAVWDREANWNDDADEKLEEERFVTVYGYDATGKIVSEQTPDGSVVVPEYNRIGSVSRVSVRFPDGTSQTYIEASEYDANGQYTFIRYGNGVSQERVYEDTTQRLLQVRAVRGGGGARSGESGDGGETLQNIEYCYDPVGNVMRVRDSTYRTVFCNGQIVEPLSDYTYDPLYRLVRANGRKHPGIEAYSDPYGFKQSAFARFCPPHPNDGEKLENYQETYAYDESGNLITLKHRAASASWTRTSVIAPASNRLIRYSSGNGSENMFEANYDGNGNMSGLENIRRLYWNYRNLPARADTVTRAGEPSDSGYYVYDGNGQRVRQIVVTKISDGVTEIREKLYLGKLEIKRIRRIANASATTVLERQSLFVSNDEHCAAISDVWLSDTMGLETDKVLVRKDRYRLHNLQGSSCLETDRNANRISYEEYFPYGGTAVIAGNSEKEVALKEYRYCGKERDDNTGLYYYGARYYPPWLGRWISPDPAGTVDGLNLYAFVGGNPVTWVDAGGLATIKFKNRKSQAKKRYAAAKEKFELFRSSNEKKQQEIIMKKRGNRALRVTKARQMAVEKQLHKLMDRAKVAYDQFSAPPSTSTPLPNKVANPHGAQGYLFTGQTTYVEQQLVVSKASLNVDGRDSTNQTMAKAYGHGITNLPASEYSGRDDSAAGGLGEAWCHLIAHCLGGAESADNLVAGSQGSNLVQLGIEQAIKSFVDKHNVTLLIRVGADVRLLSNGAITHIADKFYYQIFDSTNNQKIYQTSYSADILRADTLQKAKSDETTKALYEYFGLPLPKKLVA